MTRPVTTDSAPLLKLDGASGATFLATAMICSEGDGGGGELSRRRCWYTRVTFQPFW